MAISVRGVMTPAEIKILLDYFNVNDDVTDARPDVRSKHPRWDAGGWPQEIIERVLRSVLTEPFVVEETIFTRTRIPFQLHADSGDGYLSTLYKAVILPLEFDGSGSTIFFENEWHGPAAKFTKENQSPFRYWVPDQTGEMTLIPDLREFRLQLARSPDAAQGLELGEDPLAMIDYLIEARQNRKISKVETRINDYSGIKGYRADARFPESIHQEYLRHIPLESLHGLTVEKVIPWEVGGAILFDRTQLHAAGGGHRSKTCVTLFTRLAGLG